MRVIPPQGTPNGIMLLLEARFLKTLMLEAENPKRLLPGCVARRER